VAGGIELTDQQLALRARAGDGAAFGALVLRHHAAIYRVCLRILSDPEDAADATQDAFMRAHERLSTFQDASAFKTWMTRVAVNVSLNLRAQQHPATGTPTHGPYTAASAEDVVVQAETAQQLHHALQQVPFVHRVAVILRDLEGYSYREVARTLDVPEGTAKGWAHRGRAQLRALLS
jgi:RNA polymerase sigma-70 factor (ECF subfamily)